MEGNRAIWECKATRKNIGERRGGRGEGGGVKIRGYL